MSLRESQYSRSRLTTWSCERSAALSPPISATSCAVGRYAALTEIEGCNEQTGVSTAQHSIHTSRSLWAAMQYTAARHAAADETDRRLIVNSLATSLTMLAVDQPRNGIGTTVLRHYVVDRPMDHRVATAPPG